MYLVTKGKYLGHTNLCSNKKILTLHQKPPSLYYLAQQQGCGLRQGLLFVLLL